MTVVAAATVIAPGGVPAWGQNGDFRNAATWYERSFERLDAITISDAEWLALRRYEQDPAAVPPQAVREVLLRVQPALSAVRRGARQDYSDFHLDYARGFDLTMPHLARLRDIGRLMSAEAMVRLHDGDATRCADGIASLNRLAGHVAADDIIISSLIAQAISSGADRVVQAGLDRGAFGPVESARVRASLEYVGADDPFGYAEAIGSERDLMIDWLRRKYAQGEDRARMLDELSLDAGPGVELAGLTLMDQSRFERALDQADEVIRRIETIFSMEDQVEARLELDQLNAEIERGRHGALSMLLAPNYENLYDRMIEAQDQVAGRIAELDALIAGIVTPDQLANAAVWYLRAASLITEIEPRRLLQLEDVVGNPSHPVDDVAVSTLDEAAPIVETLREAAAIARCDFSIAARSSSPVPAYLGGLREAVTLLHADAIHLWQQDRAAGAAERLAICYRMSAHLAGSASPSSSLVSHVVFNDTERLMSRAVEWEVLSDDDRRTLRGSIERMDGKDPFGYISSLVSARRTVEAWLAGQLRDRLPERQRIEQAVRNLDGDDLLFLLVIIATPDGQEPAPLRLQGLDDVISLESLFVAQGEAGQVAAAIVERGHLGALRARDIGHVERRLAEARADYRRAIAALKTDEEKN